MQLIIDLAGTVLQVRNECFAIKKPETPPQLVHPMRVTSICLVQYASITTAAAGLAAAYGIPVVLRHAQYPLSVISVSANPQTGTLKIRQALAGFFPESAALVKQWLLQKIRGQFHNLETAKRQNRIDKDLFNKAREIFEELIFRINTTGNKEDYAAAEAFWAGVYWQMVRHIIRDDTIFAGREQKDCKDRLNPCLNYAYAILHQKVEVSLLKLGLDPAMGFLHAPGPHKKPLVYDIMEIWRPQVDKWLLNWIMASPGEKHWQTGQEGIVRLTKEGRKAVSMLLYEQAMAGRGRGKMGLDAEIDRVCKNLRDMLMESDFENHIAIKEGNHD